MEQTWLWIRFNVFVLVMLALTTVRPPLGAEATGAPEGAPAAEIGHAAFSCSA